MSREGKGWLLGLASVTVFPAVLGVATTLLSPTSVASQESVRDPAEMVMAELGQLRADMQHLTAAVSRRHQEETVFLKILWLTRYSKKKPSHDLAREIAVLVCRYAKLYDRDPDLVLAIINHESDFDPKAKSKIGYPARGLMQIMPHWKKVYDIKGSLHDPETSIRYGLLILGSYEEMYHDLKTAIIVYNRGPSPVDWDLIKGKNPANDYMRKIMKTYDQLQKLRVD